MSDGGGSAVAGISVTTGAAKLELIARAFAGNPRAIDEAGEPLVNTLAHAMALLLDQPTEH